jgi:hypothetical protein
MFTVSHGALLPKKVLASYGAMAQWLPKNRLVKSYTPTTTLNDYS